jgi:isopentenyl phosphate kinase
VIASEGKVSVWETTPIRMALSSRMVPVIFGDVVFDEIRGGTILSTESLFGYLVRALNPERILLAGFRIRVRDFPAHKENWKRSHQIHLIRISAVSWQSREWGGWTGGMESCCQGKV